MFEYFRLVWSLLPCKFNIKSGYINHLEYQLVWSLLPGKFNIKSGYINHLELNSNQLYVIDHYARNKLTCWLGRHLKKSTSSTHDPEFNY